MRKLKRIDWDDQPLGEISDRQLARQLGVKWQRVTAARMERTRARLNAEQQVIERRQRQAEADAIVEAERRAELARIDEEAKRERAWWDAQPLGEVPDTVIARRIGKSATLVREKRLERGIPAYVKPDPWKNRPVGKMPDAELAERYGVSRQRVHQVRVKMGIPPYSETTIDD